MSNPVTYPGKNFISFSGSTAQMEVENQNPRSFVNNLSLNVIVQKLLQTILSYSFNILHTWIINTKTMDCTVILQIEGNILFISN